MSQAANQLIMWAAFTNADLQDYLESGGVLGWMGDVLAVAAALAVYRAARWLWKRSRRKSAPASGAALRTHDDVGRPVCRLP